MEYEIQHDPESGIICLRASGSFTGPEEADQIHRELIAAATEHQCSKILMDHRAGVLKSITEAYQISSSAEQSGLKGLRARIAVLHDPKDANIVRFLETTSLNRGFIAKMFVDRDQALTWLADTPPNPSDAPQT